MSGRFRFSKRRQKKSFDIKYQLKISQKEPTKISQAPILTVVIGITLLPDI
jgi:hypothetical protein